MHPVGDESSWSESYYFNFVDPESRLGMFTRMGFRPGDGWADALHVVYVKGSRVAFTYGRRNIESDLSQYNADLSVGNLSIHCQDPHKKWQIMFDGAAQDIHDSAILLERRKLRPDNWFKPAQLKLDMTFDCITNPHKTSQGAYGHFEQSGRVSGAISLGDEHWDVAGYGVRDKSWGPRDWGASSRNTSPAESNTQESTFAAGPFVNWFSMNFGEYASMGGSCFRHSDGVIRGSGWIQRAGESRNLNNIVIESEYRQDSILHTAVRLTGEIEGAESFVIHGTILNVCPTKVPMPGGATFINEGLAEFTWEGRTGFGIAEHWHAVSI